MKIKNFMRVGIVAIATVIAIMIIVTVVRQLPRTLPTDPADVRAVSMQILNDKCIDCHDSRRDPPFYALVPIAGSVIRADIEDGVRHWDLYDNGHLGANIDPEICEAEEVPLGRLIKLRTILADGSMPPLKYRALHWGTSMTTSEQQILRTWVNNVQADWLAQWGITNNLTADIHPIPDSIPYDVAKAELGEKLYFDTRFSKDNTVSCATCHELDKGGTDNLPVSVGVGGLTGKNNAPTVFNAAFHMRQFWDGRAAHLAQQAGGPPLDPVEMASENWDEIVAKFEQDTAFKAEFVKIYPEGFCEETLCDAIAEYEKRLITPNSRFDLFLKGDTTALNEQEARGYAHFVDHKCTSCHNGPAMGGLSFEYVNLKDDYFKGREVTAADTGLAGFSQQDHHLHRFKVPTLRNITLTGPYLHDGSEPDLKEAVRTMGTYLVGNPLNDDQVNDITAFLGTLTGTLFGKDLAL